ncbi:MAG: hypothetical protein EZS28_002433 [Streblomastix strix]|nr:MAG: hypothetical protein EZS28_002433 [Streblomastix strix]
MAGQQQQQRDSRSNLQSHEPISTPQPQTTYSFPGRQSQESRPRSVHSFNSPDKKQNSPPQSPGLGSRKQKGKSVESHQRDNKSIRDGYVVQEESVSSDSDDGQMRRVKRAPIDRNRNDEADT